MKCFIFLIKKLNYYSKCYFKLIYLTDLMMGGSKSTEYNNAINTICDISVSDFYNKNIFTNIEWENSILFKITNTPTLVLQTNLKNDINLISKLSEKNKNFYIGIIFKNYIPHIQVYMRFTYENLNEWLKYQMKNQNKFIINFNKNNWIAFSASKNNIQQICNDNNWNYNLEHNVSKVIATITITLN